MLENTNTASAGYATLAAGLVSPGLQLSGSPMPASRNLMLSRKDRKTWRMRSAPSAFSQPQLGRFGLKLIQVRERGLIHTHRLNDAASGIYVLVVLRAKVLEILIGIRTRHLKICRRPVSCNEIFRIKCVNGFKCLQLFRKIGKPL
jgi:hypothetical protein